MQAVTLPYSSSSNVGSFTYQTQTWVVSHWLLSFAVCTRFLLVMVYSRTCIIDQSKRTASPSTQQLHNNQIQQQWFSPTRCNFFNTLYNLPPKNIAQTLHSVLYKTHKFYRISIILGTPVREPHPDQL